MGEKIELLLNAVVKPNQELIDIVNSYTPNHITVWKPIDEIIAKYQRIAIEFEVKELIKRKHSKQDRFTALLQRVDKYYHSNQNTEIDHFINTWKNIQSNFNTVLHTPLDTLNNFQHLN